MDAAPQTIRSRRSRSDHIAEDRPDVLLHRTPVLRGAKAELVSDSLVQVVNGHCCHVSTVAMARAAMSRSS
jgi:hypothetical protein